MAPTLKLIPGDRGSSTAAVELRAQALKPKRHGFDSQWASFVSYRPLSGVSLSRSLKEVTK